MSDLFSRLTYKDDKINTSRKEAFKASILANTPPKDLISKLKNLEKLQSEDKKIVEFMKNCRKDKYKTYSIVDNKLYNGGNIVVPDSLINDLILETHEIYGHIGAKKVFELLYEAFYYKKFRNKCNQLIKVCKNCQYNKHNQKGSFVELETIETTAPHQILSMDFYGPLPASTGGCTYLLVTIDAFSKFVVLYPVVRATSQIVAK